MTPCRISRAPDAIRNRRSPVPGQPFGNIENSRCTGGLRLSGTIGDGRHAMHPSKGGPGIPLSRDSRPLDITQHRSSDNRNSRRHVPGMVKPACRITLGSTVFNDRRPLGLADSLNGEFEAAVVRGANRRPIEVFRHAANDRNDAHSLTLTARAVGSRRERVRWRSRTVGADGAASRTHHAKSSASAPPFVPSTRRCRLLERLLQ